MKKLFIPMAILALVALVAGCDIPGAAFPGAPSTQSGLPGETGSGLQTGTVEIRVTDAPRKDNITEIWVGVSEVQIHKAGTDSESEDNGADWTNADITGQNPFELLALRDSDGLWQKLADAHLAAGKYTQIRMTVDNVTVKVDGVMKDAEVPSGKLRFVHPFEVVNGGTTVLKFDFDADKMVTIAGKSGKILVKPVVKLTVQKPTQQSVQPTQPTTTQAVESLKITTPYLPNGNANTAYSAGLAVEGGSAPYSWTVLAGLLPPGLGLGAATGVISGTPTQVGDYSFTVKVSDNSTPAKIGTKEFSVSIAPQGTLQITTKALPDGQDGQPYNATVTAIGGTMPYTWSVILGNLPDGLTLSGDAISGTPAHPGNSTFTIQVTDNVSHTASRALSIKINQK